MTVTDQVCLEWAPGVKRVIAWGGVGGERGEGAKAALGVRACSTARMAMSRDCAMNT